ncbi:MAG: PAS domain S-box protein, partial [Zoogloeaceae bacterium]|nr:PAS domain S-box protein [Zoogloeaceae bacterium]
MTEPRTSIAAADADADAGASILRSILDACEDGIILADGTGHTLAINRRFRELWGFPDELVARADEQALLDHAMAQVCNPVAARAVIEQAYTHERELRDLVPFKDGRVIERYSRMIDIGSGQARLWCLRDVSARVQMEAALRKSECDLRLAQAIGKIGSWTFDPHSDALSWSQETCRMFGLETREGLSFADFMSFVHPDDRKAVEAAWERGLKTGHYEIEHRIRQGGQTEWVLERAEINRDADGRIIQVTGTVQNITERRQVDAELEQHRRHLERLVGSRTEELEAANAQLRANDLRLQALFDLSQIAPHLDERALLAQGIERAMQLTGSSAGRA